ncbi:MAG: hypothetical protein J1F11_01330 [Oscillospiraceae bacterium]|nr:hypothetical protein [Oscillospiraceae bacterium]
MKKEMLETFGCIVAIVANLGTILYGIASYFKGLNVPVLWLILPPVASIILVVFFYCSISSRKQADYADTMSNVCTEIHKYIHTVRDLICSCVANTGSSHLVCLACQEICSLAERAFNKLWCEKYTVSICIKRIINSDDEDFKKWELETIARNANVGTERKHNDAKGPVCVGKNSDFLIILDPARSDTMFACQDLTNVDKDFRSVYGIAYENSNEEYCKYYKSTIVAPIRIALNQTKAALYGLDENTTHHVVGFFVLIQRRYTKIVQPYLMLVLN